MKNKKKSSRKSKDSVGRSRDESQKARFLQTSQIVETMAFILFSVLFIAIGFFGQQPKGPNIILGQAAPKRFVAEFPFSYVSEIKLEKTTAAVRAQVPPVFMRSFAPFNAFDEAMAELTSEIAKTQI